MPRITSFSAQSNPQLIPTDTQRPLPCTDASRISAEKERLARWWAGLVRTTKEWHEGRVIRPEFLGAGGVSGDLGSWHILPHSEEWARFIERVREIASVGSLRAITSPETPCQTLVAGSGDFRPISPNSFRAEGGKAAVGTLAAEALSVRGGGPLEVEP